MSQIQFTYIFQTACAIVGGMTLIVAYMASQIGAHFLLVVNLGLFGFNFYLFVRQYDIRQELKQKGSK